MVSMSQAYSMRQLRKQGDSVAEIAREVEASRSAVRSNLAKNDLSLPGYPLRPPRSRSGHQHTRLGNRDACAQHRLDRSRYQNAPHSAQANPTRDFWTVSQAESARNATQRRRSPRSEKPAANNPCQKPHRSPGPMAKSAPISCETAQKSRGATAGKATATANANAGATDG